MSVGRDRARWVGGGAASQTAPRWARLGAVHRVSGDTRRCPGRTPCDLPLGTSLSLESPGKEGRAREGPQGRGSGKWAPLWLLSQNHPVRWKQRYRLWLSPVVLEFSNAPCDWLPRPSHPAPGPDWPRGAACHPTRCTPGGMGGGRVGGLSLGHLCDAILNPPCPEALGESWVQSCGLRLC